MTKSHPARKAFIAKHSRPSNAAIMRAELDALIEAETKELTSMLRTILSIPAVKDVEARRLNDDPESPNPITDALIMIGRPCLLCGRVDGNHWKDVRHQIGRRS